MQVKEYFFKELRNAFKAIVFKIRSFRFDVCLFLLSGIVVDIHEGGGGGG
ncbi:MAG: hypothetical protein LBS15_00910 [Endomicrobium sp.]|jgi:hypothetical protein|nr:hypothetical protein [Endomicrobium sp.]